MGQRKKRTFTTEQKAEAVRLYHAVGNYAQVGRDLDIHANVLRGWVKQAAVDAGDGAAGELTTAERAELRQLKRDLKRVRMERDFLKKAAAFFAREGSPRSSG